MRRHVYQVSASRLAAGAADAAPEKTQPQRRSRRSTRRSKNRDSQEGDELSAKVAAMAGASLRPKQRDTFLGRYIITLRPIARCSRGVWSAGGKWVSASLAPDQINNESQVGGRCCAYIVLYSARWQVWTGMASRRDLLWPVHSI